MPRKTFDCRDWPGECTLAISREEDEVIEAQLVHVVQAHAQKVPPELRDMIRACLKDAPAGA